MHKINNRVIAGILVAAITLTTIIQPQAVAASGKTEVATEQPTTTEQPPEAENPPATEQSPEVEKPPISEQPPSTEQPPSAEQPSTTEEKMPAETEAAEPEEVLSTEMETSTEKIEIKNLGETEPEAEKKEPERKLSEVFPREGMKQRMKKGPFVTEVSDFSSFFAAVNEAIQEDGLQPEEAVEETNGETVFKEQRRAEVRWRSWEELPETVSNEVNEGMEESSSFQNKRLIVNSTEGFDPGNAVSIIQGYDNIYILSYETEEDTKAAYEQLLTIPGLTVGTDDPLMVSEITETPSAEDFLESGTDYAQMPVSKEIKVAVLDSGYDVKGCGTKRILSGLDATGGNTIQDENGHGTAMTNIILDHSSQGVNVMPIKVTDREGRTSTLRLYMGIRYAVEHGADIINISLNAYKSSDAATIDRVITEARNKGIYVVVSAGNAGDDVINYAPANSNDAIVVSAMNADYSSMAYSNHGATVDFSTYGSLATTGKGGSRVEASGTSVSAALMSMQFAQFLLMEEGLSYETVLERMQGAAKDLGEPGRDTIFGYGAITPEMINAIYQENVCYSAEIFSCDWRGMSDEALNEIIAATNGINLNRFLKDLSESDREELLARNTAFSQIYEILENITADPSTCRHKEYDRYYDYLMEQEYSTSWMTTGGAEQTGYFYVQHNNAKRRVNASYDNLSTGDANPVPTVTLAWESGSKDVGINFENSKVGGAWGDESNIYLLMNVKVSGLEKHSYVKDGGTTNNGEHGGGYTDGFADCTGDNKSKGNIGLQVSLSSTGIKLASNIEGGNVTATYPTGHAIAKLSTGQNDRKQESKKASTCTQWGSITYKCEVKKCEGKWTEDIAPHGHNFAGAPWQFGANNGIGNGMRWHNCTYNCNESGWQIDFQYLQRIYYRYMDENGNYPGYSVHVEDYYSPGSYIPACGHVDNGDSPYETKQVAAYLVAGARQEMLDISRKVYTVRYNGNKSTGGDTKSQTICVGKTFQLSKNEFTRKGYLFQGWSTRENGAVVYSDRQTVTNLAMTNNTTVNLYAVWKPIVYTIRYDGNGATGGGTLDSRHTYDELRNLNINGYVKDGYDFAGWSTTPDGSGERFEDGSKLKEDLSETEGEVVTLYALWKCFNVTYFRNAYEKESEDKMKEDLHHRYTEPYEVSEYEGNNKEQGFMTVNEVMQKGILPEWEFIDNRNEDAVLRVGTRERENEEIGEMEEIPAVYSLAGWSVTPESVPIVDDKKHFKVGGRKCNSYFEEQILEMPQELVDEALRFPQSSSMKNGIKGSPVGTPFAGETNISLNAIWDSYPVIHLTERFFTLEDAKAGKITPEEILSRIKVTDDEDGVGEEKILDLSKVKITDYNPELIASFDDTGSFTMRIEAEDSAKNVSTRMIKISIADTRAKEVKPPGEVRFISEKYYDDLPENSVWKADPDYKRLILNSFENLRYHEETAKVAEVEFMGKVYRKKIPGSGGWKRRPAQIWYLDHAEVLKLQAYVEENFEKSIRQNNGISEEYLQGVYDMLKADGCLIEDNLPEIERQNEALKEQREREKKQEVIQEKQQKIR